MAAYQVWARAQVNDGVKPVNSAINSAMEGMDFCSLMQGLVLYADCSLLGYIQTDFLEETCDFEMLGLGLNELFNSILAYWAFQIVLFVYIYTLQVDRWLLSTIAVDQSSMSSSLNVRLAPLSANPEMADSGSCALLSNFTRPFLLGVSRVGLSVDHCSCSPGRASSSISSSSVAPAKAFPVNEVIFLISRTVAAVDGGGMRDLRKIVVR
jgi:hypothetical protein